MFFQYLFINCLIYPGLYRQLALMDIKMVPATYTTIGLQLKPRRQHIFEVMESYRQRVVAVWLKSGETKSYAIFEEGGVVL